MWLGALGRLVLLLVRPLLMTVLLVSFEVRPPRLLSANRPPHFSTHLVPIPQRNVAQLVLHAPDAMESLSYSRALELGVLHLAAFVAHFSPENIRSESRSRGCHLPLTSLATLHIPLGSKFQHVGSWISPEHDLCKRQNRTFAVPPVLSTVPGQAILAWLETFRQPSRVSDSPLHNWVTRWYFHIIPRSQTLHNRSRHALNSSVCLFHPAS